MLVWGEFFPGSYGSTGRQASRNLDKILCSNKPTWREKENQISMKAFYKQAIIALKR